MAIIAVAVISLLVALFSGLQILIAAFKSHILWGLAVMFVPCAFLVFVIQNWEDCRKPFWRNVIGSIVFSGLLPLVGMADWQDDEFADFEDFEDVEMVENADDEPAGLVEEPQSAIGKAMKKARDTIGQADQRAKETAEMVEEVAEEKPQAKGGKEEEGSGLMLPFSMARRAAPNYKALAITGTERRRVALINTGIPGKNANLLKGDKVTLSIPGGSAEIECLDITETEVVIKINGREPPVKIAAPIPKE